MAVSSTDVLVKPDMRAVLSRTHLAVGLQGFLLPLFEAISNALDGIQRRFGTEAQVRGRINVQFREANDPRKILISVTDNGVGLDDENYQSFRVPFSGYKLSQRGRGFGRFIAFKVFERVMYSSRHEIAKLEIARTFRFNIDDSREFTFFDGEPDFDGPGLCVEYNQPLPEWHDLIRTLNPKDVRSEIGAHFLPYFLYRWLPKITIQFNGEAPEDITAFFRAVFVQFDAGDFLCDIDGTQERLDYSLTRIPKDGTFKKHCLLLSAADRIVGYPRDLSRKIGEDHFIDENDKRYIIIAVVRGDAFEKRLNDARTSIDITPKTVENIVNALSEIIQEKEAGQIQKIKGSQSSRLGEALMENPILRLGLRGRTVDEYVSAKPNNWGAEQFVSDLAIERYRATTDLNRQIAAAASNPENYNEKIRDIVSKVDAGKKEALAEYVIHRKNIIQLVESTQKYRADDTRAPEDEIHNLVFRRFSDNVKTGYFEHNLWLIDDALAFLPYVCNYSRGGSAGG